MRDKGNSIEATINGETEYLQGVEKTIYERGGASAVLERRRYLDGYRAFEREVAYEKKRNHYLPKNEKSTARTDCTMGT